MFRLSGIQIPLNQVLIQPNADLTESMGLAVMGSVEDRKLGILNTKARHFDITGIVLMPPEKLFYGGVEQRKVLESTGGVYNDFTIKDLTDSVYGSMEYDIDMELAAGDKIWFDYGCHYTAYARKKILDVEGFGLCYLIDYGAVFLAERNGDRFPVNGWIWVKHISLSGDSIGGGLLSGDSNLMAADMAVVVKTGKAVREYLHALDTDFLGVNPGDTILYKHKHSTPLEYIIHQSEGLEGLLKIRRKDIIGILEG